MAELCRELNLGHGTDLLRTRPAATTAVAETRHHALDEDPCDYAFDYGEGELAALAAELEPLAADHEGDYCQFNNFEIHTNARNLAAELEG